MNRLQNSGKGPFRRCNEMPPHSGNQEREVQERSPFRLQEDVLWQVLSSHLANHKKSNVTPRPQSQSVHLTWSYQMHPTSPLSSVLLEGLSQVRHVWGVIDEHHLDIKFIFDDKWPQTTYKPMYYMFYVEVKKGQRGVKKRKKIAWIVWEKTGDFTSLIGTPGWGD